MIGSWELNCLIYNKCWAGEVMQRIRRTVNQDLWKDEQNKLEAFLLMMPSPAASWESNDEKIEAFLAAILSSRETRQ